MLYKESNICWIVSLFIVACKSSLKVLGFFLSLSLFKDHLKATFENGQGLWIRSITSLL